MYFYIVRQTGNDTFKFGISTRPNSRRITSYQTAFASFDSYVFECNNAHEIEACVKKELADARALRSHDSGIRSEVADIGEGMCHLFLAFRIVEEVRTVSRRRLNMDQEFVEPVSHPDDIAEDREEAAAVEAEEQEPVEQIEPILPDPSYNSLAAFFRKEYGDGYAFLGQQGWYQKNGDKWDPMRDSEIRFEIMVSEFRDFLLTEQRAARVDRARFSEAPILASAVDAVTGPRNVKTMIKYLKQVYFVADVAAWMSRQNQESLSTFLNMDNEDRVVTLYGKRYQINITRNEGQVLSVREFSRHYGLWTKEKLPKFRKGTSICGYVFNTATKVLVCNCCNKRHLKHCCENYYLHQTKSVFCIENMNIDAVEV